MTTKKDASPEYAGPTLGKGTGGGSQEDRSNEGAAGSEGAESSETPEGVEIAEGEDMVLPAGGILTAGEGGEIGTHRPQHGGGGRQRIKQGRW